MIHRLRSTVCRPRYLTSVAQGPIRVARRSKRNGLLVRRPAVCNGCWHLGCGHRKPVYGMAMFLPRAFEGVTSLLSYLPGWVFRPVGFGASQQAVLDLDEFPIFHVRREVLPAVPVVQSFANLFQSCIRSPHVLLQLVAFEFLDIPLSPDLYVKSISMSDVLTQFSDLFGCDALYFRRRSRCRLQR
jgi:hypothetical protein